MSVSVPKLQSRLRLRLSLPPTGGGVDRSAWQTAGEGGPSRRRLPPPPAPSVPRLAAVSGLRSSAATAARGITKGAPPRALDGDCAAADSDSRQRFA
jgi:hypothetical protein